MTGLTAVGSLARLVLRRDRVRAATWFATITLVVMASGASIVELYSTPEQIAGYVEVMSDNPAVTIISGPGHGFDDPSTGVVFANEVMMLTAVAVALMSIFLVVRNTRTEEELERTELLRSGVVGRHAPLGAALSAVIAVDIGLGTVLGAGSIALGLPARGAVAYGLATAGTGIVFATIAAVTAQVATTGRGAVSLGGALLGSAFALRAVGDMGNGALSWLSPLGWAQSLRPWADERWWVAGMMLAAAACFGLAAYVLEARRDLGGGLLPQRPGRAEAPEWITNPWALAWRLQRAMVAGWLVAISLMGLLYGSVADEIQRMIEDSPELADFLGAVGGADVVDAYLATILQILAMLVLGFALASVLRIRSEETSGRVEAMLAGPRPRWHWASGHLLVAAAGSGLVLLAGGLAVGAGMAIALGDAGQIPRFGAAVLVHLPAVYVVVGIAVVLVGWLPRLALASWGVLGLVVVVELLGGLIRLPHWLTLVSPFGHVPLLPASSLEIAPLVLSSSVAAGLLVAGLVGLGRRDLA